MTNMLNKVKFRSTPTCIRRSEISNVQKLSIFNIESSENTIAALIDCIQTTPHVRELHLYFPALNPYILESISKLLLLLGSLEKTFSRVWCC